MKLSPSVFIVPLLVLTTGCSSHVSGGYGYGHHGHVSISGHGHGSGAAIAGALIVGGIIGTIIADSKNKPANRQAEQANYSQVQAGTQDELVNGYAIDNSKDESETVEGDEHAQQDNSGTEYQTALAENQTKVQWYQYGKDGNCYLMGVDKGVTDVVSAVPKKKCTQ